MEKGKFYGVGVGPGDPELLTYKAVKVLRKVDVIFIPKSNLEKRSLAFSIVGNYIQNNVEQVEVVLPMTKDEEKLERYWKEAASKIKNTLDEGKDCAFITLGDPGMYSTFSYVLRGILKLDSSIEVEVIPGVSAVNSVSSWLQQPLAEGEESFVVTTALKPEKELKEIIQKFENVVIMKAGKHTEKIASLLQSNNFNCKSLFISRAGFNDVFCSENMNEVSKRSFDYLSTFFIKKYREEEK